MRLKPHVQDPHRQFYVQKRVELHVRISHSEYIFILQFVSCGYEYSYIVPAEGAPRDRII